MTQLNFLSELNILLNSVVHIVAKPSNQYFVAFHIAILKHQVAAVKGHRWQAR